MAQGMPPQGDDGPGAGGHRMGGRDGGGMGMMHGDMGMMHGGMMHGRRHFGHGMGMAFLVNNPEMRAKLGITDEQAAKIRQQTLDFQKAEIRNRAELQTKRLDLHSLLAAENPDRAAIDRTLQEVGAAQVALEKTAIDYRLAMRGALTPEQRAKLKAMREEFRQHGRGGWQGGPGGPGGPQGMQMHHHGGQGAPPPPAPAPQQ
jgi:Spy/CpxP family protein refolding chaperone